MTDYPPDIILDDSMEELRTMLARIQAREHELRAQGLTVGEISARLAEEFPVPSDEEDG